MMMKMNEKKKKKEQNAHTHNHNNKDSRTHFSAAEEAGEAGEAQRPKSDEAAAQAVPPS